MKRKIQLLLCVIAMMALCLTSCFLFENDEHEHSIEHVEAKAATCTQVGNIEYWYCTECEIVCTDSAFTQQTELANTVVNKLAHEYTNTCDAHCKNCGELTNESAAHTVEHVEAKAATCTENGNVEYWYCTVCGSAWTDEAKTQVTNLRSVVVPATDHEYLNSCDAHCMNCGELTNPNAAHNIVHVEAKAGTDCQTYNGNVEYWTCSDCGYARLDEALTQQTNLRNVVVPGEHSYFYPCDKVCQVCFEETNPNAAHTIVHVEAKAGTDCQTYDGNIEYWACSDCGYVWADEALTQQTNRMNVVVPGEHSYFYSCDKVCQVCFEETNPNATHTIAHVEAVDATCYENGNIEYWYCEACGYAWADEALTQQTNMMSIVIPMAHAPATHVEAKDATCVEDGNIEYWYCEACGQAWLDEACTLNTNVKSVILPALGHTDANYDGKCETCGKYFLPEAGVAFKLQLVQANLGKTLYFTGKMDGYYYATGDYNAAVDVYIEEADGGFNMYFLEGETKKYLYVIASGTYINVKIGTSNEGNLWSFNEQYGSLVTVVNGTDYYIGTYNSFNTISASKTSFVNASNVNVSQFIARAIVIPEHEHVYSEATCTKLATCSVCALTTGSLLDHSYGEGVETAPTCTADGFTTYTCVNCSATKKEAGEAALGHTTESGVCENCGENIGGEVENPALSNATLSFADKANRTSFSTSQQVWEQNGVKVTNNKASSTSNVADYANPARFYANSQVIVEGAGMTKIAFTCGSSSYATALKNSIGTVSGATVTVSGSVVTVVFETAVDSFNIAKLTAQVRMSSITVNG